MSRGYTMKRYVGFVSLVVFLLILSTEARAEMYTYGFKSITNTTADSTAIGEAQLFVDVSGNPGVEEVLFTFRNVGPEPSTIGEVYFDDGTLLGIADIYDNPPDVDFIPGIVPGSVSPPDLPSGNNAYPPFQVTAGFLADSAGNNSTGVDTGESLGILFNLLPGKTITDVIAAIIAPISSHV